MKLVILSTSEFAPINFLYALIAIVLVSFIHFGWPYLMSKRARFNFIDELLLLTAHVMNIDDNTSTKEKMFVSAFFSKEFGVEKSVKYMQRIDVLLKQRYSINTVLKTIDYKESEPAKIQLLNFLIKITIVDSYLTDSEYSVLLKICKGLTMPVARLTSMLAMYDYVHEQQAKNEKRDKRHQKETFSASKLDLAYKVLELKSNASDKEIKKSYRKLVVLYHPDKLVNTNPKQKQIAKGKFQKINDAYDLLKSRRGFR